MERSQKVAAFMSDGTELYADDDIWQRLALTDISQLDIDVNEEGEEPKQELKQDKIEENEIQQNQNKGFSEAIEFAEAAKNEIYLLWGLLSKIEKKDGYVLEEVIDLSDYEETMKEAKVKKILEEGKLKEKYINCSKILEDSINQIREKYQKKTKYHSQIIQLSHYWKIRDKSINGNVKFELIISLDEYYQKALVPISKERVMELYQSNNGDVKINIFENNKNIVISGIEKVHDKLKEIQEKMKWELCMNMIHYLSVRLSKGLERTLIHNVLMCNNEDSSIMMIKAYLMQMFLSYIYEEKMTCRHYSREYLKYVKNLIRKTKKENIIKNEESEEIKMDMYDIMDNNSSSESLYLENEYEQERMEIKREDEFKESSDSDSEYSNFGHSYINALKYYFNQEQNEENIINQENEIDNDEYILENFEEYINGNLEIYGNKEEKSEEIKLETPKMNYEELKIEYSKNSEQELVYIPETLKQIYYAFKEAVKFEFGIRRPIMHLIKKEISEFTGSKLEFFYPESTLNIEIKISIKNLYYGNINIMKNKIKQSGKIYKNQGYQYMSTITLTHKQFEDFFPKFCKTLNFKLH